MAKCVVAIDLDLTIEAPNEDAAFERVLEHPVWQTFRDYVNDSGSIIKEYSVYINDVYFPVEQD